jgi:DNA-directed RNA polymerase subunit alpha
VLLSSLEGAAVTAIKIKGAEHEFTSLPGVMEDVTDIVLNVKNLIVKLEGDEPKTMRLAARGPGEVTADMIQADTSITILNKDLVIATLTEPRSLRDGTPVGKGRGYVPASEQYNGPRSRRSASSTSTRSTPPSSASATRSRKPASASDQLRQAHHGDLDQRHRHPRDGPRRGRQDPPQAPQPLRPVLRDRRGACQRRGRGRRGVDEELIRKLNMPISELELSVRASNCLESARIETVAQLVTQTEADLLKLRSFGRTSLREVKRKLQDIGLDLA